MIARMELEVRAEANQEIVGSDVMRQRKLERQERVNKRRFKKQGMGSGQQPRLTYLTCALFLGTRS